MVCMYSATGLCVIEPLSLLMCVGLYDLDSYNDDCCALKY